MGRDEDDTGQQRNDTTALAPLATGILIGGESRRMGSPKQLLEWRGESFLAHVAAALLQFADPVVLLGEGESSSLGRSLPRLADPPDLRGRGPLAGMIAALRFGPESAWLIAGCDQPLISPAAIEWLLGERRAETWAILPCCSPGRIEPLLALYEPAALPLLEELAASGDPSPQRLAGRPHVASPEPPPELRVAWRNVNTPEDLEELRNLNAEH